ncbi:MAG: helix-turn-helix domain-containing protein [Bacilli bacterium]
MTTFKRDFDFVENLNQIISYNVRKYRKLAGITQEQLAVDIGISPDYIRRFESQEGKEGISIKTLYKISVVLNVPMDKFFEELIED